MAKVSRKQGKIGFKELAITLEDLGENTLQVGWFESAKYDDNTPVAYVASIQEFGTASGGIPPRPFMRPTIEKNKRNWAKTLESGLRLVVNGEMSEEDLLDALGQRIAGEIRKSISNVTAPELSPITLALRKQKIDGVKIGGAQVGATAKAIAEGKTGPGELGDSSGINPKPLVVDGILLNSVTHKVDK